jgi:hypothetical protein
MPQEHLSMTDEQIDAAAKWLAENVLRVKWDGLYEGSARERGFDPWVHSNARKDDVRDAVRGILRNLATGDASR